MGGGLGGWQRRQTLQPPGATPVILDYQSERSDGVIVG